MAGLLGFCETSWQLEHTGREEQLASLRGFQILLDIGEMPGFRPASFHPLAWSIQERGSFSMGWGGGESFCHHSRVILCANVYVQPFYGGRWLRHEFWSPKNLGPDKEPCDPTSQSLCPCVNKMWPMRISTSQGCCEGQSHVVKNLAHGLACLKH